MLSRLFIVFMILAGSASFALAQNEAITQPQLFYKKRITAGVNINSSGLGGINFRYGTQKTELKKNMLDVEFARVRHPKETRISGVSPENPQRYVFGRLNMLFLLRTGLGRTLYLTQRPYKNAVQVNLNYFAGVSTALLKPVYLDIFYNNSSIDNRGFVRSERYDPNIHTNQSAIFGNSSFFNGINQTEAKLGGYGRFSLAVEWGEYPEEFNSVEAGFTVDMFPQGLPLMAFQKETSLIFNFFIGYQFGWNK
jgi:hypothetical protein